MPPKSRSPQKLQKKQGKGGKKQYRPLGQNPSQASLMSQSSSSRKPRSFLLVVLAVKVSEPRSHNDFMIGDFAGIKYHMNMMGFEDDKFFWSTVNLAQYCTTGKHNDIKIRGEVSEKVVYSRFKALHRQDDYVFVDEKDIKSKFLEWMKDTTRDAQPHDVINIVLITHGSLKNGAIQFGKDFITPKAMAKLLSYFQDGVQVNVVLSACGSGLLCKEIPAKDQKNRFIATATLPGEPSHGNGLIGWTKGMSPSGRFRSSFFTDVIIKSLGKLNLDRLGPTIEQFMESLIEGVQTKPDKKSTPTFAGSSASKEESHAALQTILHLDYFDFPPDPKRASRYLRQESDMQMVEAANEYNVNDFGFGAAVLDFFKKEVQATRISYLSNDDAELFMRAEREIDPTKPGERATSPEVMRAIMFRAKIQSTCFSIFLFLQDQRLITTKGLEEPMSVNSAGNDEIRELAMALGCFELFLGRTEYPFRTYAAMGYAEPVFWLATAIVRGALVPELWCLIDRMSCYEELGKLDLEHLRDFWPEGRRIKVDPNAGLVPPFEVSPAFCFWLPHSMGEITDLMQIYKYFDTERFAPFEELFFNYFKLPMDGSGVRERQCSSYIKTEVLTIDAMEF
ncbi:hypothetical protein VTL71DRAFT_1666 [Oculimacula yallundae]|uniref:CHAT domain-containing protein n=1 Tax=Oculimacula yallundae TaxID=86028 RepID=A0ABR4CC60_9HELO